MILQPSAVKQIRQMLAEPGLIQMPCCFDAFSAKLIQQSGFKLTFISGFSVSSSRLAMPDTGLITYSEMHNQATNISAALDIPVICDGDTGFGNAANIRRTVLGYAQAGVAGIMIEDQRSPKRCGHTKGKEVVSRSAAIERLNAALDAREQLRANGSDIIIIARTDARATKGLTEAIERANLFNQMGADIIFVEAPCSEKEMEAICTNVNGHKMANILEQGETPILPPAELEAMGFKVAAYPLTMIAAAAQAMQKALEALKTNTHPTSLMPFFELQEITGFGDYDELLRRLEQAES